MASIDYKGHLILVGVYPEGWWWEVYKDEALIADNSHSPGEESREEAIRMAKRKIDLKTVGSQLREDLANTQHEIWAHWMKYLFQCCQLNEDGSMTIPADKVSRWKRQIETAYSQLSDSEKESDRHQADKVLDILSKQESV